MTSDLAWQCPPTWPRPCERNIGVQSVQLLISAIIYGSSFHRYQSSIRTQGPCFSHKVQGIASHRKWAFCLIWSFPVSSWFKHQPSQGHLNLTPPACTHEKICHGQNELYNPINIALYSHLIRLSLSCQVLLTNSCQRHVGAILRSKIWHYDYRCRT